MVDYLGDLQPAGDEFWGSHQAWLGEELQEERPSVRHSPPDRPFSSLEEEVEDNNDSDTDGPAVGYSRSPASITGIEEQVVEDELLYTTVPDPIRLRGVGGTTMFGLNSHFEDEFPSHLVGKVAPEEFHTTMDYINSVLHKSIPFNLKCLVFGCLCCPCTLGVSMGPVLYLSKRTQSRIEKFMAQENWRLYNKLGLNLKLHKEQCEGTNLKQYVILFEFLPKLPLYKPD